MEKLSEQVDELREFLLSCYEDKRTLPKNYPLKKQEFVAEGTRLFELGVGLDLDVYCEMLLRTKFDFSGLERVISLCSKKDSKMTFSNFEPRILHFVGAGLFAEIIETINNLFTGDKLDDVLYTYDIIKRGNSQENKPEDIVSRLKVWIENANHNASEK